MFVLSDCRDHHIGHLYKFDNNNYYTAVQLLTYLHIYIIYMLRSRRLKSKNYRMQYHSIVNGFPILLFNATAATYDFIISLA